MQISTLTFQEYLASCSATSRHASDKLISQTKECTVTKCKGKLFQVDK